VLLPVARPRISALQRLGLDARGFYGSGGPQRSWQGPAVAVEAPRGRQRLGDGPMVPWGVVTPVSRGHPAAAGFSSLLLAPGVSLNMAKRVLLPCSPLLLLDCKDGLAMAVLWPWRARSTRVRGGGVPGPLWLGTVTVA
jgi:hypothetical protein